MKRKYICTAIILMLAFIFCACGTNIKSASLKHGNFSKYECEAIGCEEPSSCEVKIGKEKHHFCSGHSNLAAEMYNRYLNGENITEHDPGITGEEI